MEISDTVTTMFLEKNVAEWQDVLESFDTPSYWTTFSALVCLGLTFTMEDSTADSIIFVMADLFSLPQDDLVFITETYLPKVPH